MQNIVEFVWSVSQFIVDIIPSVAAIIVSVVAVMGLNTWKNQLHGKSEYELAGRLLVGAFRLRDAIKGVRNPAMFSSEMPLPPSDIASNMTEIQIHFYGKEKAYASRWNAVGDIRGDIYADLLESEALWGNEIQTKYSVFFELQGELTVAINSLLVQHDPDMREETKRAYSTMMAGRRDVIYAVEGDDPFQEDVDEAIREIEVYLRPKLSK